MGLITQRICGLIGCIRRLLGQPGGDEHVFVVQEDEADEYSRREERRRHVRFPVELAVRYGGDDPVSYQSFTLNVCERGLYILTDKPFPRGTLLTIHLFIPPASKLLAELQGVVVEANSGLRYPQGMHIEILRASEDELQRLNDYMEEKRHILDTNA